MPCLKFIQIKGLAVQFEIILGRPVIDKTILVGEYEWQLPYSRVDKNILISVREKSGLELVEKKQQVKLLIIEKPITANLCQ